MTGESAKNNRKPVAFDLDSHDLDSQDSKSKTKQTIKSRSKTKIRKPEAVETTKIELTSAPFSNDTQIDLDDLSIQPTQTKPRRSLLLTLTLVAIGFLITASIGLAIENIIVQLQQSYPPLAWAASVATVILFFAIVVLAIREVRALRRLHYLTDLRQKISNIRQNISNIRQNNDDKAAQKMTDRLLRLYGNRADMAHSRAEIKEHQNDLLSAEVRLDLTERALFQHLDKKARNLISKSSARVAVVTAVSPRALIDIGYVLVENMRLIRAMAELYGAHPGFLGSARLAGSVLTHLAMTGSLAIGDGLLQQMVGTGLATRLSSRLGEGAINGLLTARIGISAMDLCRPMPFNILPRPRISDFVNPLTTLNSKQ